MSVTEKQTCGFQTEVKQLLQLMIHSLYSNKEIFIRELISNASDAVDRLRFQALAQPELYERDSELTLRITIDKPNRRLIFTDNGIGMRREECIAHLGTIAKSGTKEFLAQLTGDKAKDSQLIGQFGMGFYSSFMVAEKVIVHTRAAGVHAQEGVCWESTGDGEYTISALEKADRGTEIILELKDGEEAFLEDWRLRSIILKYSDHISLPIYMQKEKKKEQDDDYSSETETTSSLHWEVINKATALWTLPKNQIKEEEYKAFYQHIAHDFKNPLVWTHNKVEGKQEYTTLLYIPEEAPFDLWNYDKPRGLKLYVRRVFIMDDTEQFLPRYLRFVKGIIDSNDLPLNVSREILQDNKLVDTIRTTVIKRILDLLANLAQEKPETYQKFWKAFGNVLKEGLAEDFAHRAALAKLLRFASTHSDSAEPTVSLTAYCERMKPGQDKIYYITAENYAAASHSPHLEIFRKNNIEVFLLHDRIDEWLVSYLTEFDGKPLQSVAKDAEITGLTKEENAQQKEKVTNLEPLLKQIKEILRDKVKEVRISKRLTDSPACIVNEENSLSSHMQRILQATGQAVPTSKPILELNAQHRLVQALKHEQDDARLAEWAHLFLEQSILAEGGYLEDPAAFVKRLNELLHHFHNY